MNNSERYVFGSLVSGDYDKGSDIDVLLIADETTPSCPDSWSVYTKQGIKNLYKKGNLFAWHLFLTAIPISTSAIKNDFLRTVGEPTSYDSAINEIEELRQVAELSFNELLEKTPSVIYELGLLAVSIRDIAMAASLEINGKFNFGKNAPFELGEYSLSLPEKLYTFMISCRRATIRGFEPSESAAQKVKTTLSEREKILQWIDKLLAEVRRKKNELY